MFIVRRVAGQSMQPLLRPGRIVIALRRYRQLGAGDIVVVRQNGLEKIKRIANISNEGLFLLGDNPLQSTDSRDFGRVAPDTVVAKVIWPVR